MAAPGGHSVGAPGAGTGDSQFRPPSPGYSSDVRFCAQCGNPVASYATQCTFCGTATKNVPVGQKSRIAAGLLGLFLGAFGVHSFYLGDNRKGAIQIGVTVVTCGVGGLWGMVEGVLILVGKTTTDADGQPLGD